MSIQFSSEYNIDIKKSITIDSYLIRLLLVIIIMLISVVVAEINRIYVGINLRN